MEKNRVLLPLTQQQHENCTFFPLTFFVSISFPFNLIIKLFKSLKVFVAAPKPMITGGHLYCCYNTWETDKQEVPLPNKSQDNYSNATSNEMQSDYDTNIEGQRPANQPIHHYAGCLQI